MSAAGGAAHIEELQVVRALLPLVLLLVGARARRVVALLLRCFEGLEALICAPEVVTLIATDWRG